ncbi:hypothetical protein IFM89_006604 [Coptis chinensis]|uniref:Exocyst component Exo84 C-terminal domain-containing protein n=1 Tax=Coptis chinensis TaxID=261450 RepID=A0A835I806_9MAGN|nr:hypothetical protein IFM89_006604 [Coptis chinensis]
MAAASVKSSRSRGSSVTANGGLGLGLNGSQLEDKLNIFKSDGFDPDAFVQSKCHSLNEKEIRQLCNSLLDLKKASAEEMRRSVYANYSAFIRTSKEISDLEGELLSIRNLLSTQAALIHGLSEGVNIHSMTTTTSQGSKVHQIFKYEDRETSNIEKWTLEFPDLLDVLLAERRIDEALASLDEGERLAAEAKENKTLSQDALLSLQTAITEHKQKLADQLAEAACQPSTRGIELRAAVSALKRLGDGPRAHSLLLNAHYQRFLYNMRSLRPSSTSYGGAYTAALSQLVFSAIAQAATADNWVLTYPPSVARQSGRSSGSVVTFQHKLSSSAHRFNSMVQDFFEDVGPLLSMQLGGPTLEGLFQVFNSYVNLLIKALPGSIEDEGNLEGSGNKIVRLAETETQQIALLANASLLADELLPRAAMKLSPINQANIKDDPRKKPTDRQSRHPEQREWRRRLQRSVDRLRDSFCQQHALDLIFTEDSDTPLCADMYINMDENTEEPEWFPSPVFQELFTKLNRMASIAADMFVGRERFVTLLLMRLTETVILYLSNDQSFWEDIEDGQRPLGPLGLQQFYLDMKFVYHFSSQRRYSSRHLHQVINDIISRAMAVFSSTGMDPDSVLPEDEWFIDICQEAIEKLTGKTKAVNGERDLNSPTASVSAQSTSSVRSHGSS